MEGEFEGIPFVLVGIVSEDELKIKSGEMLSQVFGSVFQEVVAIIESGLEYVFDFEFIYSHYPVVSLQAIFVINDFQPDGSGYDNQVKFSLRVSACRDFPKEVLEELKNHILRNYPRLTKISIERQLL